MMPDLFCATPQSIARIRWLSIESGLRIFVKKEGTVVRVARMQQIVQISEHECFRRNLADSTDASLIAWLADVPTRITVTKITELE